MNAIDEYFKKHQRLHVALTGAEVTCDPAVMQAFDEHRISARDLFDLAILDPKDQLKQLSERIKLAILRSSGQQ